MLWRPRHDRLCLADLVRAICDGQQRLRHGMPGELHESRVVRFTTSLPSPSSHPPRKSRERAKPSPIPPPRPEDIHISPRLTTTIFPTNSNAGYPLCATATFGGPGGYTYLSCTDTYGPTQTMLLTYIGGNATSLAGLPRYFNDYWENSGSSTATSTGGGSSTSTSDASGTHYPSWFSDHRTIIYGAIGGFVTLFILFILGCCAYRRRASRRAYMRASQGVGVPVYNVQPQVEVDGNSSQETYPMMGYQGYQGGRYHEGRNEYGRVYVVPSK